MANTTKKSKPAKTVLFRARIDATRKARAEKIFYRFGLTPGEAVNVFFAKVNEIGGIPFDLRPSETEALLDDPGFARHLERMKAGEVDYFDADAPAPPR